MCGCHHQYKTLPCSEAAFIKTHVRFHLWVRDALSAVSTANELQPGTQGNLLSSSRGVCVAGQPAAAVVLALCHTSQYSQELHLLCCGEEAWKGQNLASWLYPGEKRQAAASTRASPAPAVTPHSHMASPVCRSVSGIQGRLTFLSKLHCGGLVKFSLGAQGGSCATASFLVFLCFCCGSFSL